MTIKASAKINLFLEVYAERTDGYHALRSVVAPVSLSDVLEIEPTDDGEIVSDTGFPDDLCVTAARALRSLALVPRSLGMRVSVTKRIPVGGGLGGGSADAAAVLRALNVLWRLGKTPEELAQIGASVGSDVPAILLAQHYRRPVLMEGRGERVTLLDAEHALVRLFVPSPVLVLANPRVAVSTAEIYRLCSPRSVPSQVAVNDLQEPAVRRHPEIALLLEALRTAGVTDVRMSGSGATCFGFVPDAASAARIAADLNGRGFAAWSDKILFDKETPTANKESRS